MVRDTGIGIPPEMAEKIFEPYFQLGIEKKINDGMGLGLSIVKAIVQDLKGAVEVNSEPGKGTEMKVQFIKHELGLSEIPQP
jgi:signal transduction histidine kinase